MNTLKCITKKLHSQSQIPHYNSFSSLTLLSHTRESDLSFLSRTSAKQGNIHLGTCLHASIIKIPPLTLPITNTHVIYNSLFNLYCKCGDLCDAVNLFDEMPVKDTVSWNTLISGFFKNGLFEIGFGYFKKMLDSCVCEVDQASLTSSLSACGVAGLVVNVEMLHALAILKGFVEQVTVGNALTTCYFKCRSFTLGMRVFDEMVDRNVDYHRDHPEVIVIDPPGAIEHVRNRQSMLNDVADLTLPDIHGKVCIPKQLVISEDPTSIPDEVSKAGLRVPLVVKPLVVDGSAKSHELFLVYDQRSLSELEPPVVLQEFVNHGGVLFKVYVLGEFIKVVRRFSLPDVTKCELPQNSGVFPFPRVSCAAASAEDVDLDPSIAELPPRPLLVELARELRHRLGLQLFNVDMIRQKGTKDLYYVIDINYFPACFQSSRKSRKSRR